jgi:hypothetical protein
MAQEKGRKQERKVPAGSIRLSQMVTTFGPGAMVDLLDRSIVIGGLEHWSYSREGFTVLDDARLRRSLLPRLKKLDPDLDLAQEGYFRAAPEGDDSDPAEYSGVRVLEFPRWFVCHGCRRLGRAGDAFPQPKKGRYYHDCGPNKRSHAVPVRFVAACKNGHLSDFPWVAFAHPDGACDRPELYLTEGPSGDVSRIIVECRNCNAGPRSMSQAVVLPFECHGDRPWLGGRAMSEPCGERMKMLVRTASDAYFAQVVSALRLPETPPSPLALKLEHADLWSRVENVSSADELALLMKIQPVVRAAFEGVDPAEVLEVISAKRNQSSSDATASPLRTAEYERFLNAPEEVPGVLAPEKAPFVAYRIPAARASLPPQVSRLVIVPELREVRVQVSFSRFDSVSANLQGEYDFNEQHVRPAVLTLPTGNQKWLPAVEVRGEGVFIELDEEALLEWESRDSVKRRADQLHQAFVRDGGVEFLGVRFYLLHSLSHLLLTAISLECGYAASSIRERIYSSGEGEEGMAGILLSTGTTGSEGTLGGLVEEGRRIRHHLREAWDLGRLCSNDPVCAGHDPAGEMDDRRLEGAACHGCLYIAECSCERFNRYLDRALVVPTIGNPPDLAFFMERP